MLKTHNRHNLSLYHRHALSVPLTHYLCGRGDEQAGGSSASNAGFGMANGFASVNGGSFDNADDFASVNGGFGNGFQSVSYSSASLIPH